ncbi:MAG TPA: metallophosphoesterase family protein [Candidatus Acidoferrum sp.]|nr:metallophosphoesterase family protein [Candidatus Acidoferrum sp.]
MPDFPNATRLGLISDTHGLLRKEAIEALRGSELILHAGDVGDSEILKQLRSVAPVIAIRGNIDTDPWADALPTAEVVTAAGLHIYMLHDLEKLDMVPEAAGFAMVLSGHSHKPLQEFRRGVFYLNPGSAGPRRFQLPITVARLDLTVHPLHAEIISLATT